MTTGKFFMILMNARNSKKEREKLGYNIPQIDQMMALIQEGYTRQEVVGHIEALQQEKTR